MAKYYELTGRESLLQRFIGRDMAGLNAQRKLEAEAHADNWIDRKFHDWNTSAFAIAGDVPAQIAEIAEFVATAEFCRREFMQKNKDPLADPESVPSALMKEAMAVVEEIHGNGYVLANNGDKISQSDGTTTPDMFVDVAV